MYTATVKKTFEQQFDECLTTTSKCQIASVNDANKKEWKERKWWNNFSPKWKTVSGWASEGCSNMPIKWLVITTAARHLRCRFTFTVSIVQRKSAHNNLAWNTFCAAREQCRHYSSSLDYSSMPIQAHVKRSSLRSLPFFWKMAQFPRSVIWHITTDRCAIIDHYHKQFRAACTWLKWNYPSRLQPRNASSLFYCAASILSNRLRRRIARDGRNIVFSWLIKII